MEEKTQPGKIRGTVYVTTGATRTIQGDLSATSAEGKSIRKPTMAPLTPTRRTDPFCSRNVLALFEDRRCRDPFPNELRAIANGEKAMSVFQYTVAKDDGVENDSHIKSLAKKAKTRGLKCLPIVRRRITVDEV